MMPTRMQYFFAKNWPLRIWRIVCILAGMAILAYHLSITEFAPNRYTSALHVGLILLAGIVGFFVSLIFSFILLPIYSLGDRLNGAPFRENEEVQIIVGQHRGKTAIIYEIWSERRQVRVYLGDEEKETVDDVFSYTEIFRIRGTRGEGN